jgi:hypothetical protein
MLTSGESTRITLELMLGLPPSNPSAEAAELRCKIEQDLAEMKRQGIAPDLVCDWDEDLPPRPAPPVPTAEEQERTKLNLIRHNLASGMALADSFEQEAREIAEERAVIEQELEGRIEAAEPLTETIREGFLREIETLLAQEKMWPSVAKRLKRLVRGPLATKPRTRKR